VLLDLLHRVRLALILLLIRLRLQHEGRARERIRGCEDLAQGPRAIVAVQRRAPFLLSLELDCRQSTLMDTVLECRERRNSS
jgi:hypothetical protein